MLCVDINSDIGESFGRYSLGCDDQVLQHITSANIACGFHAGDPMVMAKTVAMAVKNNVSIGAHPGYPDLQGFGRRRMTLSSEEIKNIIIYQVSALKGFVEAAGCSLQHVKPHGALYNMAVEDAGIAEAIASGIKAVAPNAFFLAMAGTNMALAAEQMGLKVAYEVYADRAYNPDGILVPRTKAGSVIHDTNVAIARAVRMVTEGKVTAVNGEDITIKAHTICVHGDNPEAVAFVAQIRTALNEAGVNVIPLSKVIA